ncbi:MAG: DUF167 domain-containing protein [Sphingomonadales bacterium]|nr:DUF167 domain-containing protein [Sphingomonadales bacterium]MDE2170021.1 DUF167 domain-containing protein [Sphingomonadales bacterium]
MARPKADLPEAAALLALVDDEGRLAVRVTPGARVEMLEIAGGRLCAKVRAKPEDGKANAAVVQLVAQGLGLAPSRLSLLKGATSRDKLLGVAR